MRIVAVDPGPVKSAIVQLDDGHLTDARYVENEIAVALVEHHYRGADAMVLETVANMGMVVGKDVFDTVEWTGQFIRAWHGPLHRLTRVAVKTTLCGSASAKDANVRQAVIDYFGGDLRAVGGRRCPDCHGKGWTGRKRDPCASCTASPGWSAPPGPLHGIKGDVWQALAVGIAWMRRNGHV